MARPGTAARRPAALQPASTLQRVAAEVASDWRSAREIAERTRLGASTVRRTLARLRADGALLISAGLYGPQQVYRLTDASRAAQPRPQHDYYRTPPAVVEHFLERWRPREAPKRILDPCAGDGAFLGPLRGAWAGVRIDALDIEPRAAGIERVDFFTDWGRKKYDLIISNPPFKHAVDFIEAAMPRLRPGGYCVMLVKVSFLASQERDAFFRAHPPREVLHLAERPSFTPGGGTDKFTDYAWVVWQDGYRGRTWRGRRI